MTQFIDDIYLLGWHLSVGKLRDKAGELAAGERRLQTALVRALN